jgi:1-acyl-sn-glycerol-3-phosphate acyltransferase
MRFLVWILIHTVYRVRKEGLERIPDEGPALLVCNHVSFVDALVIAGCCQRPVRFVMDHRIFKQPVLNFVFRTAGAIPIAPARAYPEMLRCAYQRIAEYLNSGEIVCIFPEGRITDNGEINPFRSGIEHIVRHSAVPVIPMALRGLWGSCFSRCGGSILRRLPRGPWSRIALAVGMPVAPEHVSAVALHDRVVELRGGWK